MTTPTELLDRAERLLDAALARWHELPEKSEEWHAMCSCQSCSIRHAIDAWKRDKAALVAEGAALKSIGTWYTPEGDAGK